MLRWPEKSKKLWGASDELPWLRGLPRPEGAGPTSPWLSHAGSDFQTINPDGMWFLSVGGGRAADVLCIEHCGTMQNLHDKRQRYAPSTHAIVLHCRSNWLNHNISKKRTRRSYIAGAEGNPNSDLVLPLRNLRVLYALRPDDYKRFQENGVPAGHEFFIRHGELRLFNNQAMQEFLKRMSPVQQFFS